jgi:NAD(P)-dependent dehydrogenase (short-subunit alcohol dehydrogenase family)
MVGAGFVVHTTTVGPMNGRRVDQLLDLSGKVAVVTGASGNIGASISRRLHEAGASVAIHHSTNVERANELALQLNERVMVVGGDVQTDAARIVGDVLTFFGRLDMVVNNAGIQPVKALLDISPAEATEMLRVNVGGVIAMTTAGAAVMARESSIVNIASIEGVQPAKLHSHYNASKAAVIMHTRAAALELGSAGIRVNAVLPGLIHVEGIEEGWPDGVERWQKACPLSRLGQPEDIADATLFMVSPAARWITGASLVVDGGVLTNNTW